MLGGRHRVDGCPTVSEWPIRIWSAEEVPEQYAEAVNAWIKGGFSDYEFVYAPKRRTSRQSYAYMFGYGKDGVLFLKESDTGEGEASIWKEEILREQITAVSVERELLKIKITLHYHNEEGQKELEFPYVPSVYYLYDPFLNWILGREKEFMPGAAEREHPRPQKLYHESLAMFNFSLEAYRLGEGFDDYCYESKVHRRKWLPGKKTLEEWLEVSMERGKFELHSLGYFRKWTYYLSGKVSKI
ncbi:MAG: hypothetical protein K2P21_06680 [Lachnospiraceae bacterium]|nr:hypothetical protein [Lachnospiraceae bacterium]